MPRMISELWFEEYCDLNVSAIRIFLWPANDYQTCFIDAAYDAKSLIFLRLHLFN